MAGLKNIQSQMFDVRPVTQEGSLDVAKINQVTGVLDLSKSKTKGQLINETKASLVKRAAVDVAQNQEITIAVTRVVAAKKPVVKKIKQVKAKKISEPARAKIVWAQAPDDLIKQEYFSSQLGAPDVSLADDVSEVEVEQPEKSLEALISEMPAQQTTSLPEESSLDMIDDDYMELLHSKIEAEQLEESSLEAEEVEPEPIEEELMPAEILPSREELLTELAQIDQSELDLVEQFRTQRREQTAPPKDFLVKEKKEELQPFSDLLEELKAPAVEMPVEQAPVSGEVMPELKLPGTFELSPEIVPEVKVKERKPAIKKEIIKPKVEVSQPSELDGEMNFTTLVQQVESNASEVEDLFGAHNQPIVKEKKAVRAKKEAKPIIRFILLGISIVLIIPGLNLAFKDVKLDEKLLGSNLAAFDNLMRTENNSADQQSEVKDFASAYSSFMKTSNDLIELSKLNLAIVESLSGQQLVGSGQYLIQAGDKVTQAAQKLSQVADILTEFNFVNLLSGENDQGQSTGQLLDVSQKILKQAKADLKGAYQLLDKLESNKLPAELQQKVEYLTKQLPLKSQAIDQVLEYIDFSLDVTGQNGKRQYLLVFQDTDEKRPTGGLIGTYGLLVLENGQIADLFVEGVYNADSQLKEKIVPPRQLQEISTAWSLHDANWFANWPTSADKVSWFYEKISDLKVDGVISFTAAVAEGLLKLTGPIEMPDHGVTLTAENFVEVTQHKSEVDFDRELNQPKKIISDFTPKLLAALKELSAEDQVAAMDVLYKNLSAKQILIFLQDKEQEAFIENLGWAGQLRETAGDFLSVVSSNIGGAKSDHVVAENIDHQVEIQADGSVVGTVAITRKHNGGRGDYAYWNQLNSSYIKVYLPKGSQLLSAKGQTLERYFAPLDYVKEEFSYDPLVRSIEESIYIDAKTGTQVYVESDKTVFGNWLNVKPGKSMTMTYTYKLPFKVSLAEDKNDYTLLVQKQSGSQGVEFKSALKYPSQWQASGQYPGDWSAVQSLDTDKFYSASFSN